MKTAKELLYCNIKDLKEEEKELLERYELNFCDKCGQIDNSIELWWPEYCELTKEELESINKYSALCDICWEDHWQNYNKTNSQKRKRGA